jgi:Tfp pilus assembly protein FimT
MRHLKGLTLLELVIVMCIAPLPAFSALPSFTDFIQNNALRATTRDFVAFFRVIQICAITENTYYRIRMITLAIFFIGSLMEYGSDRRAKCGTFLKNHSG